jgi:hypothetical protein
VNALRRGQDTQQSRNKRFLSSLIENSEFFHFVTRVRWEDNIKMDLREVGCGGADWVDLAQDRDRWRALVYTEMNLRVP